MISGRRWEDASIPHIVRPFRANERIAIASPRHRLAGRSRVTLAQLAAEPFIVRVIVSEPRPATSETAEEALQAAGLGVRPVIRVTGASVLRTRRSSDSSIATGGGRRSGVPWPPNEISTEASRTARLSGRSLASRPAEFGVEEPGCDRYLPRGWRVNSPPGGGDLATVTTVLPSRGQSVGPARLRPTAGP